MTEHMKEEKLEQRIVDPTSPSSPVITIETPHEEKPAKKTKKDTGNNNDDQEETPQAKATERPTLQQVIREQAIEEEAPMSKNFTLRKILGGDILSTQAVREQIWLVLLIVFFIIIYISNRYSCQQDQIEIDQLKKELVNAKHKALSSNSQLTEKTRESKVLEMLRDNNDSILKIPQQPPYVIRVEN